MKIAINSNDTYFHIDTYSVFTLDSEIDNEIDYLMNESSAEPSKYDDYDYEVDHEGHRLALALASINYIKELTSGGGIIKDILYENSTSPRFYNYTTDSYTATWFYNKNKLKKYINDNYQAWQEFTASEWSHVYSNVNYHTKKWINDSRYDDKTHAMVAVASSSIFNNDDCIASMIDFYTRNVYMQESNGTCGGDINSENYLNYMFDAVQGYEYITITKEVTA